MLQVGNLSAKPGEKTFGYLETAQSRSGMRLDIPVHLIAGAQPGPTLMLQGAIHGAEIIGSIAILDFVATSRPQRHPRQRDRRAGRQSRRLRNGHARLPGR